MNSPNARRAGRRPPLVRALIASAFGIGAATAAGAGVLAGVLVGMWIGVPIGIFVGAGAFVSVPTAFVMGCRRVFGIPSRPGLTLLWMLMAAFGALFVQLLNGTLVPVPEDVNPYSSPPVITMIAVFVVSAAVAFVGLDTNGDDG